MGDIFNIDGILYLLLSAVAALVSITVHEVSHGLTAYALGDDTAKNYGRLSLNPLHHLDWIGVLCLVFLRFGWAKPVPVNFSNLKHPRRDACLVSLAGPLSNFILAFLAMLIYYLLVATTSIASWQYFTYFKLFFQIMLFLNLGLGLFNLIPVPPLDGSKILASFLPPGAAYRYLQFERYGFLVLMAVLFIGNRLPFGLTTVLGYAEDAIVNLYDLAISAMLGGLL